MHSHIHAVLTIYYLIPKLDALEVEKMLIFGKSDKTMGHVL